MATFCLFYSRRYYIFTKKIKRRARAGTGISTGSGGARRAAAATAAAVISVVAILCVYDADDNNANIMKAKGVKLFLLHITVNLSLDRQTGIDGNAAATITSSSHVTGDVITGQEPRGRRQSTFKASACSNLIEYYYSICILKYMTIVTEK